MIFVLDSDEWVFLDDSTGKSLEPYVLFLEETCIGLVWLAREPTDDTLVLIIECPLSLYSVGSKLTLTMPTGSQLFIVKQIHDYQTYLEHRNFAKNYKILMNQSSFRTEVICFLNVRKFPKTNELDVEETWINL